MKFENDADYPVTKTLGKRQVWMCPFYRKWQNMKNRAGKGSYKDVVVCGDWHKFSRFKSWMQSQDWDGMELDKDLLGDGGIYSPDSCCFVPAYVNLCLVLSDSSRGEFPVGVSYMKTPVGRSELTKPFQAYIKAGDKKAHLGMFSDPHQAHKAWQACKVQQIEAVIERYSSHNRANSQVVEVLNGKLLAIKSDIDDNRETKSI